MDYKIKLFECLGYFIVLYTIALCSNLKYREDDDVLWVARSQWKAIFLMWIPSLVIFFKS